MLSLIGSILLIGLVVLIALALLGSGHVILGLLVLGGLGAGLYYAHKDVKKNPPGPTPEQDLLARLYSEVDALLAQCFDEKTYEFNWDHYFRERDAYLYCGKPVIVKYLKDSLKHLGYRQILYLNSILTRYNDVNSPQLRNELKANENNIILNLSSLCGGAENTDCPAAVETYRQALYDVIYQRRSISMQELKQLGQAAQNAAM